MLSPIGGKQGGGMVFGPSEPWNDLVPTTLKTVSMGLALGSTLVQVLYA